jgi:hypothetical protein
MFFNIFGQSRTLFQAHALPVQSVAQDLYLDSQIAVIVK